MANFEELWDSKVKDLAIKCVNRELVLLLNQQNPTEEQKAKVKEMSKPYKDVYGMMYISQMLWQVEHDLADQRDWKAKIAVINIYHVISPNNTEYWKDVFKDDLTSEEAQNLKNLAEGLQELLNCK